VKALIIGASRGIGLEFVRQMRADALQVTATARDAAGLARLQALGATALRLDVAEVTSAAALAWHVDGERFDIAIIVAGVFGPRTSALEPPTEAEFDTVMHTNVLGPMRLLSQISTALAPSARLVVISSRMGSIGLRAGASGWLYRASKAAVNSVLKDASIVLGDQAVCVAMHPGWVRTDMGGAGADLEVSSAVATMRQTITALTQSHNGAFLDHDGSSLAW
jgi:NAD(P)-dependent dehydrogenase (short-subunit alcohol dehydrogenase family)